jgi:hypothetical protein
VILVGIDPGKVTGIAVWWSPGSFDSFGGVRPSIDTAEVDADHTVPVLRRMLDGERPTLIGVERYVQTGRKTHQPDAYIVTGAVRSLAEELLVRCVYLAPATAKKIGRPAVLRRLGWFVKTKDGHANAASANLLALLATFYPADYAKLVGL